jgi:hypothetical protein
VVLRQKALGRLHSRKNRFQWARRGPRVLDLLQQAVCAVASQNGIFMIASAMMIKAIAIRNKVARTVQDPLEAK